MKKKIIIGAVLCVFLLVLYFLNLIYSFIPDGKYKSENFVITEVMPDDVKVINVEDIESTADAWNGSAPVCITPISTDSDSFGYFLAINKKYLAVSDFEANRVVIYNRDENGKWLRIKEIYPPKNSISDKFGYGFAQNLVLDGDTLIIFSYIQVSSFEEKIEKDFSEIHITTLTEETILEPIAVQTIAIDNQKIAFIMSKRNEHGNSIGIKNKLSDSKISYFLKHPEDINRFRIFSPDGIALKKNLLLIANYFNKNKNYAWMFDLNEQIKTPQVLSLPQVHFADTIRISDKFIVINAKFTDSFSEEKLRVNSYMRYRSEGIASKSSIITITHYPITIIKAIDNNATTIIDNDPKKIDSIDDDITTIINDDPHKIDISLDKNILVMLRFSKRPSREANIFKIFRIDDHAIPHLISNRDTAREEVDQAVIKDGLLATSRLGKVCVEDLSKLN